VYSLDRNIPPRISFKLVKSRIKNIRRFKQGASRCKMAGTGFHCIAKIRALFHPGVEFRTAECSKCFISFGGFFLNSNIFLGEKTQTNDSDVGGPSPNPVLILYLDPGLNPDPSANPDPVTNSDPVANPDPVEYRSGCRIRKRIRISFLIRWRL
jgi:hypothetical protein